MKYVSSLVVLLFLISACKRSALVQRSLAPDQIIMNARTSASAIERIDQKTLQASISSAHAPSVLATKSKILTYTKVKENSTLEARSEIKREETKERQSINKSAKERKEMNPRLSRALWMTIPSGMAVILGIVLVSYAPTGLFIFAFGIVFLVGLISLFMYLADPKPKL